MAVIRIKSTHQASQGDFVEIEEEDFDPKLHELYGQEDGPAVIPDGWETLHWKRRVGLARAIVGGSDDISADEANGIIEAEIATRDAA